MCNTDFTGWPLEIHLSYKSLILLLCAIDAKSPGYLLFCVLCLKRGTCPVNCCRYLPIGISFRDSSCSFRLETAGPTLTVKCWPPHFLRYKWSATAVGWKLLLSIQKSRGKKKREKETSRRIRNLTFFSFFLSCYSWRRKLRFRIGGSSLFFFYFYLFCSCSPAASRGLPAIQEPFFDFYRCRSKIERERWGTWSAKTQERIPSPFNPVNSRIEMKLPFFLFLSLSFFFFLSISRCVHELAAFLFCFVVGLSVLFSKRNHRLLLSCPTHLAQSIRQRPRWQVPSTSSRLHSYHVYTQITFKDFDRQCCKLVWTDPARANNLQRKASQIFRHGLLPVLTGQRICHQQVRSISHPFPPNNNQKKY